MRSGAHTLLEDVHLQPGSLDEAWQIAALVDAVFQLHPELDTVLLPPVSVLPAASALARRTLALEGREAPLPVVERSVLKQLPLLWRVGANHVSYPELESRLSARDISFPLRPPRPTGLMYQRYVAEIDMTVSLRPIDRRVDLDLFHGWMNQGRVAYFWELAKSPEELDAYLAEQEADPHIFGVIASFNDEPVGYFEFYFAKEDRLGPYYEPQDFDRGWHALIGNARHLGRPKTTAIFRSVTHYLFLDEPRTERVVGEPRAAHQKMLSYCADVGFVKVKEFDFPHKRAALVMCERERFFREVPL